MKNIIYYMFFVLLSVLLLTISSLLEGWAGTLIYVLAFALPVSFGYALSRRSLREREESRGLAEEELHPFTLSGRKALLLIPTVAPTVALVFLVSFLTSLLLSALGVESAAAHGGDFLPLFLKSALAPAVLEELLFRYLPIILIAPYSRKYALLISSVCFTVIHKPESMPYAFIAGVIFMLADLACSSVIPSLILHLVNNTVSAVWLCFIKDDSVWIFVTVLAALAIISAVFIAARYKEYGRLIRDAFVLKEKNGIIDFE